MFFKHVLLFVGRQVAIGGVRPLGIIKPLDGHKSGTLQFLLLSNPKNVETALMYTGTHGPSETTPIEGVLASDTLLPQSPSPIVCPLCR